MSPHSEKPLRVLHVLRSADVGGIEKLVAQLVGEQYNDSELRVSVLFVMNRRGKMSGLFRQDPESSSELGLQSGFSVSPAKYFSAVERMRAFDVLHMHTFNPLVAFAAMRSGVPTIYTEHGNFGFGRKVTISDRVKAVLLKHFLRRGVNLVSFNSHFTESESMRRYGLDSVARSVVYNGIDLRNSRPTADVPDVVLQKLAGKFVVGTSSRFAGFKRVDRLISGFEKFSKENENAVLLLVGDGDLRSELEGQVAELGIKERTIFVGYQVNVTSYQALMNVCVFPSRYEPFGLVALEAYELGKPVIVFEDGGGLLEIVGKFDRDDIVRDTDGLAKRLDYYMQHQASESSQSARRAKYVERFDMRLVARKFREIYHKVSKCAA